MAKRKIEAVREDIVGYDEGRHAIYLKKCPICGNLFETIRPTQKYDNDICRYDSIKRASYRRWQAKRRAMRELKDADLAASSSLAQCAMPPLSELSPDELLHYGRTQSVRTARLIKLFSGGSFDGNE